jgi:hypothetical protein
MFRQGRPSWLTSSMGTWTGERNKLRPWGMFRFSSPDFSLASLVEILDKAQPRSPAACRAAMTARNVGRRDSGTNLIRSEPPPCWNKIRSETSLPPYLASSRRECAPVGILKRRKRSGFISDLLDSHQVVGSSIGPPFALWLPQITAPDRASQRLALPADESTQDKHGARALIMICISAVLPIMTGISQSGG